MDIIDIFDIYQEGKIAGLEALQANNSQRITSASDRLTDLEMRYERMRLVTNALWALLKEHTSLTDGDLKRFIEKVDMVDGRLDGKLSRTAGGMSCPKCRRKIRKSAVVCMWCGTKQESGDPFQAT